MYRSPAPSAATARGEYSCSGGKPSVPLPATTRSQPGGQAPVQSPPSPNEWSQAANVGGTGSPLCAALPATAPKDDATTKQVRATATIFSPSPTPAPLRFDRPRANLRSAPVINAPSACSHESGTRTLDQTNSARWHPMPKRTPVVVSAWHECSQKARKMMGRSIGLLVVAAMSTPHLDIVLDYARQPPRYRAWPFIVGHNYPHPVVGSLSATDSTRNHAESNRLSLLRSC